MKVKQYIFFAILVLVANTIFAMSPRLELFRIWNYSSKEIMINVEFWEGESKAEYNYMWLQDVCGLTLTIQDSVATLKTNVIKPYNDNLRIISYYPFDSKYREPSYAFARLDEIPFVEKMKTIFKKFEIICDDGNRVITLDNLRDQIIKKQATNTGTAYILEIFDYDLEGKPASEW